MCLFNYGGTNSYFRLQYFTKLALSSVYSLPETVTRRSPPTQGSAFQPVMHHQNRFRLGGYCPGLVRQQLSGLRLIAYIQDCEQRLKGCRHPPSRMPTKRVFAVCG